MKHVKLFEDFNSGENLPLADRLSNMENTFKSDVDEFLKRWENNPDDLNNAWRNFLIDSSDKMGVYARSDDENDDGFKVIDPEMHAEIQDRVRSGNNPFGIVQRVTQTLGLFYNLGLKINRGSSYEEMVRMAMDKKPSEANIIYVPDYFPTDLKKDIESASIVINMGLNDTDIDLSLR